MIAGFFVGVQRSWYQCRRNKMTVWTSIDEIDTNIDDARVDSQFPYLGAKLKWEPGQRVKISHNVVRRYCRLFLMRNKDVNDYSLFSVALFMAIRFRLLRRRDGSVMKKTEDLTREGGEELAKTLTRH